MSAAASGVQQLSAVWLNLQDVGFVRIEPRDQILKEQSVKYDLSLVKNI